MRAGPDKHLARVGVDVGGTFTDLVALTGGRLVTAKVPSTPADQSEGVMRSLAAAGVEVGALAHGMTVATNALLERRGARTALVTTRGFRDVIEIGRQDRAHLYDLTAARPPALVPRDLRFTVGGRMGPDGELEPLDTAAVEGVAQQLREAEVEAVAVCLLFSFLHPQHERAAGAILRRALPHAHVSLSCEVLPEFREYERFATTTADAYLGPRLGRYLARLAERARDAGVPDPVVMGSAGGVVDLETAAANAAGFVLSGPAGGVIGAAHVAAASGFADVLTFDMGGTSTDVAPVRGGEAATTTESVVAGVPIKLPMVDVHTVSAGGGSIAWADDGGALRVGPRSAGAVPGPAAYDRGGEVVLRADRAERALATLGERLGLDPVETALGVVRVANAEMARALRVISVERGLDPRDFALVAFGGAGGLHACDLAEELALGTVLIPRAGGVLSALGLAISDVRRDYARTLLSPLADLDHAAAEAAFAELEAAARDDLDAPALRRRADLRYRRQAFELTVEADDLGALAGRFHAAHEQRYGYRMDEEPVELVSLRLVATVAVERPELQEDEPAAEPRQRTRTARFDGDAQEVPVLARAELGRGSRVSGPAIVEFAEATCAVRPGWAGAIDGAGTLVLERAG